jgi:hypothetical protein
MNKKIRDYYLKKPSCMYDESITKSQIESIMTAVCQNMNSPPSYQKYGMEDFFEKYFLYSMHLFYLLRTIGAYDHE